MISANPTVLFPSSNREALIAGVLIASDRISNTFLPRPRRRAAAVADGWVTSSVPAHKCQKIRTRSEEIIVFALGIDCHSPLYHEKRKPFRRSSQQPSDLVYMRRRDSLLQTIDNSPGRTRDKERCEHEKCFGYLCSCVHVNKNRRNRKERGIIPYNYDLKVKLFVDATTTCISIKTWRYINGVARVPLQQHRFRRYFVETAASR